MWSQDSLKLGREWVAGGFANAITSAFLNPFDVVKTRMQVEHASTADIASRKPSLLATARRLYFEQGFIGLWKPGIQASMVREVLSSGPRAGFYVPVRNALHSRFQFKQTDDYPFLVKLLAALITGTIGSIIANPVDVVKIRMMVDPQLYPSVTLGLRSVLHCEGILGLYKGVIPSTLRGAFIACGELATYDHAKSMLKKGTVGFVEGLPLHVASSLITGLVAATVAAPFDLIKTRTMMYTSRDYYVNPISIMLTVVRDEGYLTLMRGWIPSYMRLGPHALIAFPLFEQMRKFLGLEYL